MAKAEEAPPALSMTMARISGREINETDLTIPERRIYRDMKARAGGHLPLTCDVVADVIAKADT